MRGLCGGRELAKVTRRVILRAMKPARTTPEAAARIVDALGGTFTTARALDVRAHLVSLWRRAGMPRQQLVMLQLIYPRLDWQGITGEKPATARSIRARAVRLRRAAK